MMLVPLNDLRVNPSFKKQLYYILRPVKIEDIPIIFQIEDAKTMVAGVDFK